MTSVNSSASWWRRLGSARGVQVGSESDAEKTMSSSSARLLASSSSSVASSSASEPLLEAAAPASLSNELELAEARSRRRFLGGQGFGSRLDCTLPKLESAEAG